MRPFESVLRYATASVVRASKRAPIATAVALTAFFSALDAQGIAPTDRQSHGLFYTGSVAKGTPPEAIFADGFESNIIRLLSPGDGSLTNISSVTLTGTVPATTTELQVNGQNATLTGTDFEFSTTLVEGANSFTFVATLSAGGTVDLNATITLDTMPAALNGDLVAVDSPSTGLSPVSGFGNATESNIAVEITNTRTAESLLTATDDVGAFSGSIGAMDRDNLSLRTLDQAGNFSAPIQFEVPGVNQAPTLVSIGTQIIDLGESLSLKLTATDPDSTLLSFSALSVPDNASLDGLTGEFSFSPDENQTGDTMIEFSVSDGISQDSEVVTVTVNPGPVSGPTLLSGVVLDTNDFVDSSMQTPVVGATVTVLNSGVSVVTDGAGQFTLSGIPAGLQVFDISTVGVTAPDGSDYAGFREAIALIEGVDNQVTRPFYLPRIAMNSMTTVNPDATTIIRNDDLGVRIEIPANTAKAEDGTDYAGPMSISLVPDAVAPAALPPGLGFGLLITIQPVGVYFANPVPIFLPNTDGLPEDSEVDIWSLDAATGKFAVVGAGQVIGNEIRTVSGGVRAADWHGGLVRGPDDLGGEEEDTCDQCTRLKAVTGSMTRLGDGALEVSHELATYRSLGEPRGPVLIYTSDTASPQPIINATATLALGGPPPIQMATRAGVSGVTSASKIHYDVSGLGRGDQVRLSSMLDARSLPTGSYDYEMKVTSIFSFSQVTTSLQGQVAIDNRSASPVGAGWGISGVDRIVAGSDGGALLVGGDGSSRRFRPIGGGSLVGPLALTEIGANPKDVVIDDFNDDTWPDIAIASGNTGSPQDDRLNVYINDGDGGFTYSMLPLARRPFSLASGLINNDLFVDLVVTEFQSVEVFLGDGTGGFAPGSEVTTDVNNATGVVLVHFDDDTNLDLAYTDHRPGQFNIRVHLGDGSGGFGPRMTLVATGNNPTRLAAADLNQDTFPDLIVSTNVGQTVEVFNGDGMGGFSAPVPYPLIARPSDVVVLDANDDGWEDLALSIGGARVALLINEGDGTFGPPNLLFAAGNGSSLVAGNFDSDPNVDLALAASSTGGVTVFLGNGAGGFPVTRDFPVANQLSAAGAGDFDKDGLDDLVVLEQTFHIGALLYGLGEGAVRGNINIPATGNSAGEDLVMADFNEDGIADVANAKAGFIEVYLSRVDSLASPEVFPVAGMFSRILTSADVNLDGNIDLVTSKDLFGNDDAVVALLGDGLGGFPTQVVTPGAGRSPGAIAAGDLNRDGLPDLAIWHSESSGSIKDVRVLLGVGDGSFAPQTPIPLGEFTRSIRIADLNLDGNPDVIVNEISNSRVNAFLGDGTGNLAPPLVSGVGAFSNDMLIADVTGDQIPDVLITNSNNRDFVVVAAGDGTGAFSGNTQYPLCPNRSQTAFSTNGFSLGDLDADGDLDMALVCTSVNVVMTAMNNGAGAFSPGTQFATNLPVGTALGDVNADGALDVLAISSQGAAGLTVFESEITGAPVALRSPPGDFSDLTPNPDGSYTRTLKDGTVIEFNDQGLQTLVTDRNGNATSYAYDGLERLETITDPMGLVTTFSYQDGTLASITDPASRVTQFEHSPGGDLTTITDPDGSVRRFEYDANHRLVRQTSKRGFVTRYDYDHAGVNWRTIRPDGSVKLIAPSATAAFTDLASGEGTTGNPAPGMTADQIVATETNPRGFVTTYRTNRFASQTEIQDPLGRVTAQVRNSDNLVVSVVYPNGRIDALGYDERGNTVSAMLASGQAEEQTTQVSYDAVYSLPVSVVDTGGNTVNLEYDGNGNLTRFVDPMLGEKRFTYDARGQALSYTDPNNHPWAFGYDALGNLASVIDPSGSRADLVRDGAGRVVSLAEGVGSADERTTLFAYDTMNRLLSISNGESETTASTFDAAGNLVSTTTPTGETTTWTYDTRGRVESIADPIRGTTQLMYDLSGNQILAMDAQGDANRFEYDAANQLIRTTDAFGGARLFTRDSNGNTTSYQDALGRTTTFDFDLLDRKTRIARPSDRVTLFGYDSRSNLVSLTDPMGQTTTLTYDGLSRLTQTTTVDDVILRVYDAASNLLTVADGDSSISFTYDGLNRVVTAGTQDLGVQPATMLSNTFDAVGNRTALDDSEGGTTLFGYDNADRLTQVVTAANETVNLEYDSAGRRTQVQFPNGVTSDYQYDTSGRLQALSFPDGGPVVAGFDYLYDAVGNILSIVEDAGTRQFSYDALKRVIGGGTAAAQETYDYDAEGNRIASFLSQGHSHDEANRLLGDDDFTYTYDDKGNLVTRTATSGGDLTTYTWDGQNQLVQIDFPDATVATYRYDGLGRRIENNHDGTVTRYVYDERNLVLEYDSANTLSARFSHGDGIDQPLVMQRDSSSYYYQSDHLGSIRRLTDEMGIAVNHYDYDSFGGLETWVEGVQNPFTFTARERDLESGLYLHRARYYDPVAGRFVSQDSIGVAGGSNLYAYAGNNPVNNADPLGLMPGPAPFNPNKTIGRVVPSLGRALLNNASREAARAAATQVAATGASGSGAATATTVAGGSTAAAAATALLIVTGVVLAGTSVYYAVVAENALEAGDASLRQANFAELRLNLFKRARNCSDINRRRLEEVIEILNVVISQDRDLTPVEKSRIRSRLRLASGR